jgi:hypothetical protein
VKGPSVGSTVIIPAEKEMLLVAEF